MTEQEQSGCDQIAFTGDKNQPTFLEGEGNYNKGLDPSLQMGEEHFPMDDIPSAEEVCVRLSQIPFDALKPYLIEQTDE